jgi:branched-chain amino acid transport system substrate-binding protein
MTDERPTDDTTNSAPNTTRSAGRGHTSRRRVLRGLGVAGVTGLSTGLAGCSGGVFGGGSEWENAIGVLTPKTGPLAGIGALAEQALSIAIEDVNDRADTEISYTVEDTEGSVETARSAAQGLIEDGHPVLAGLMSSDSALAVRETVEQEEVPLINSYANNGDVTQDGTRFTYRYIGSSLQEMKATMQFWEQEGAENIATISADYSFGQSVADAMNNHADSYGLNVVNVSLVPVETNNFEPEIQQMDVDNVDAMFIAFPGQNGPVLAQQLKDAGFVDNALVVGNYSYGTQNILNALGQDLLGLHNWGVDLTTDGVQSFSAALQDRHGTTADALTVLPYDVFTCAYETMVGASDLTPTAINSHLGGDFSYEGISGITAEFGESGHNAAFREDVNEWQEQDGSLVNRVVFESDVVPPGPPQ